MSNQARIWLSIAALVLCAAATLWFLANYERVSEFKPQPPQGEAKYNRLYLLKQALIAQGITVNSRARLNLSSTPLGRQDVLVLLGEHTAMSQADRQRLREWVSAGGHLIVSTPRGAWAWDPQGVDQNILMAEFGVGTEEVSDDEDRQCVRLSVGQQLGSRLFCYARMRLHTGDAPLLASLVDSQDRLMYARVGYGEGLLDVWPSLDFLTNNTWGEQGEHNVAGSDISATLAWRTLQPVPASGQGTVHLIYAQAMPSLLRLLLENAWMVLLPVLLATFGWLWARTQRRGALRPSPELARRALLDHVRASGEHLHRHGRGHLLYSALRDAFDARLARRDPLTARLHGEPLRKALHARTGLPLEAIAEALQAPKPFDARDLRLRIARLNQLRLRL